MGYEKVSIVGSAEKMKTPWTQLRMGSIEDYDVKLAVYSGEYNLHVHERHDEFIYVLTGNVHIVIENEDIALGPGDGIFVRKGTPHKSRCSGRAEVMLFEKETIMDDYVRLDER
jgi:mannose-6-phosphate isomerase-like protein (cupin superfamily)